MPTNPPPGPAPDPQELPPSLKGSLDLWREDLKAWLAEWSRKHEVGVALRNRIKQLEADHAALRAQLEQTQQRAERAEMQLECSLSFNEACGLVTRWTVNTPDSYALTEVRARLAVPRPAKESSMFDWQPIETAPKDGTRLLLATAHHVAIAWWDQELDQWAWNGQVKRFIGWMPVPVSPAASSGERPHAQEPHCQCGHGWTQHYEHGEGRCSFCRQCTEFRSAPSLPALEALVAQWREEANRSIGLQARPTLLRCVDQLAALLGRPKESP